MTTERESIANDWKVLLSTERFDIHGSAITRSENLGGHERHVYQAWHHTEDVARPVCIVTIWESFGNYVEWIHVEEQFRREGIATEVLRAIEETIGGNVSFEGATVEGIAFCDHYESKFPAPIV